MTTKIYVLKDPDTNQIRYVGKSNFPIKRYYKHCQIINPRTHKEKWIDKLLKNDKKPILEIIDEVSINEWQFWESYWICQFKTWGFSLVNNTEGGDGSTFGNKTSFKKGNKAWNKGKSPSNETKEKLRKQNIGKKASKKTKEKMSSSQKKIKRTNFDNILKGGKKTRFKKGKPSWNKGKASNNKKSRVVEQFDLDGNFICEHNSYKEAANIVGVNPEAIRKCCIGKSSKSKNFIWKWKTK